MSANDIAIRVENVSKVYRLGAKEETEDSLMKSVSRMLRSPLRNYRKYRSLYNFSDLDFDNPGADVDPNILWALNNVSFLAEAGVESSVGSVGDSYENALAETINGLYKTQVIRRRGPWRNIEAVEYATLEWVDWFNHRRLLEPIGNVPPAELEQAYCRQPEESSMVA